MSTRTMISPPGSRCASRQPQGRTLQAPKRSWGRQALLVGFGLTLAGSAAADPLTVSVALDDWACRHLVEHVPDPDASYQPALDVRGNLVVPADLDDNTPDPTIYPLIVPLTMELPDEAELPPGVGADIPLMRLTMDPHGTVRLDGRPLGDVEASVLAEACRGHRPAG